MIQADTGPLVPCGGPAFPPYAELHDPPTIGAWNHSVLGRDWLPPECTGWTTPGFSTLVVTAGRLRAPTAESLLERIGTISELAGIRYWSTTHKQWQTLVVSAFAVTGAAGDRHRQDIAVAEMTPGQTFYFHQQDNLSGNAIYRMRILSVSPDRIVYCTENVSTIRYLLMPLFPPGEVQSTYFLDRESREVWRYYSIARTGKKASSLTSGHAASAINRAIAYYRHIAGIPTDKEPPGAP